jgi:hypothetical protein
VRRALAAGAAAGAAGLVAAPSALAHGVTQRADLPIPQWLFLWGAALVLLVSFVALAVLWPRPRLQEARGRRVGRVPRWLDPLCGGLGVALFGLVVYAGLAGTQTPNSNLTPTFVYVVFWVGVPILSVLAGDVFRALNPWRALARAAGWAAGRVSPGATPQPLPYPERVGSWPAVTTILAFGWLELAYSRGDDPSTLAVLALGYALLQLAGMSFYGVEPWTSRADGFSVYFNLFARMSPWERRDREVWLRRPLSGLPGLAVGAGTVALLCAAIGVTTFDGLSAGSIWLDLFGEETSELEATLGLAVCVAVVLAVYRLGVTGMHTVGERRSTGELWRSFAHSLVPIALAYSLAHYFSLLVFRGQSLGYLSSDPLGRGSDLLGTADWPVDYAAVSATTIWYVQVAALVVGHVAALVLAHDRAVALYRSARDATRSQYWMLAVMIGFTSLGLWLLSAVEG